MIKINFSIPGNPQGKERPRATRTADGRMTVYTPEKTRLYEKLVKCMFMQTGYTMIPKHMYIQCSIIAFFSPAQSTSKKRLDKMLSGEIIPTKKPDLDNIAKAVLDALNGVAFYDDSQVVDLEISKRYAAAPRVDVELVCIGDEI